MLPVLSSIQRALTRAILREARQLQSVGPNAGVKVPAIYNICRTVNPSSDTDGIILQNSNEFKVFVSRYSPVPSDYGTMGKLRKQLPSIMADFEKQNSSSSSSSSSGYTPLTEDEMRCPFEILRAFKQQTLAEETTSRAAANGLIVQAITGYNSELSEDLQGENIYSYNLMFSNVSREPMRIVGHTLRFSSAENKEEFRVKKKIGISDNSLPVILPGQHLVCGSTVAFPEDLSDNIVLAAEFDMIEEGYRGKEFEKKIPSQQHDILNKETDDEVRFTVQLGDTKFRKEVLCDTKTKRDDICKKDVVTAEKEIEA